LLLLRFLLCDWEGGVNSHAAESNAKRSLSFSLRYCQCLSTNRTPSVCNSTFRILGCKPNTGSSRDGAILGWELPHLGTSACIAALGLLIDLIPAVERIMGS